LLSRIPLFGDVLRIFNAYAYRGDARADERLAPIWLWVTAFWLQAALSLVATLLCMPETTNKFLPLGYGFRYSVALVPGGMSTSILPNLLGFGIGIYALIFGLHKMLLRDLQKSYASNTATSKYRPGSALILNAEMAVPLLVLALTIAVGLAQQIVPESKSLQFAAWLSLWLSLVFTVELIVTLFGLGENVILKTLDDAEPRAVPVRSKPVRRSTAMRPTKSALRQRSKRVT